MSRFKRLSALLCAALFFFGTISNLRASPVVVSRPRFDDLLSAVRSSTNVQIACDGTILFAFPLIITNAISIDASGHTILFDGRSLCRHFVVQAGAALTLNSITLTNGFAITNGGSVIVNSGGSLQITNCTFSGNQAVGSDAEIYYVNPVQPGDTGRRYTNPGPAYGGAISSDSANLIVEDCRFDNNISWAKDGGAETDPFTSRQNQVYRPGFAFGGAIFVNQSMLKIGRATFSANQSKGG